MIQATVNEQTVFDIASKNDEILIEETGIGWDITQLSDLKYHIIKNHISYEVEILKEDKQQKMYGFRINGHTYKVELKDEADLLLNKLGLNLAVSDVSKEIKAPMPGLMLEILVKEGDEVKKGDPLLILEAMKMENIIKSPREGIIKSIKAVKGATIEKNQILIQF